MGGGDLAGRPTLSQMILVVPVSGGRVIGAFSACSAALEVPEDDAVDGLKYKLLILFFILLGFFFVAQFVYTIPQSIADRIVKG